MSEIYDAIVLGVGGMGSAACQHLAQRGARVLGIEQFSLVHDRGSSHGESRIIRQAYFEHPSYVPLLLRAYELWDQLEAASGQLLFHRTGLILSGPSDGETIRGAKLSATQHHLTLEVLTSEGAAAKWPMFRFPSHHEVAFEPVAGTLLVEDCVRAQVNEACHHGADLRENESVQSWTSDGQSVVVRTTSNEYHARALILTAGAWATRCVRDLGINLEVHRKPVAWFPIHAGEFRVTQGMPAYFFELTDGTFYGFPSLDGTTVKVAEHSGRELVADPANVDRTLHLRDVERIQRFLGIHLPGIGSQPVRHSVCLYTISPDHHFVVDLHLQWTNVVIACGFSGHGFKFTPVIGEALADLALTGNTSLPIDFLKLSRFAN